MKRKKNSRISSAGKQALWFIGIPPTANVRYETRYSDFSWPGQLLNIRIEGVLALLMVASRHFIIPKQVPRVCQAMYC